VYETIILYMLISATKGNWCGLVDWLIFELFAKVQRRLDLYTSTPLPLYPAQ